MSPAVTPPPTILLVTALAEEHAAAEVLLRNAIKQMIGEQGRGAATCTIGTMPAANGAEHTVALVLVGMGNNAASTRVTQVLEAFRSFVGVIVTGIAAGV